MLLVCARCVDAVDASSTPRPGNHGNIGDGTHTQIGRTLPPAPLTATAWRLDMRRVAVAPNRRVRDLCMVCPCKGLPVKDFCMVCPRPPKTMESSRHRATASCSPAEPAREQLADGVHRAGGANASTVVGPSVSIAVWAMLTAVGAMLYGLCMG